MSGFLKALMHSSMETKCLEGESSDDRRNWSRLVVNVNEALEENRLLPKALVTEILDYFRPQEWGAWAFLLVTNGGVSWAAVLGSDGGVWSALHWDAKQDSKVRLQLSSFLDNRYLSDKGFWQQQKAVPFSLIGKTWVPFEKTADYCLVREAVASTATVEAKQAIPWMCIWKIDKPYPCLFLACLDDSGDGKTRIEREGNAIRIMTEVVGKLSMKQSTSLAESLPDSAD